MQNLVGQVNILSVLLTGKSKQEKFQAENSSSAFDCFDWLCSWIKAAGFLTGALAAGHLPPHYGKWNFEFLCGSLRSTTKMKPATPIFHP